MTMRIQRYVEHEISSGLHASIEVLRNSCFPEQQQTRSYAKQLPHFRYLAFSNDQLVGHVGVDHRMMRFGEQIHSVFGVIALCVAESWRNCGIGSQLLSDLEECGQTAGIDALVLLAQNHSLYSKQGFLDLDAKCRWLGIDQHTNLGVLEEEINDELMIKLIGLDSIPQGPIDFLGYMF